LLCLADTATAAGFTGDAGGYRVADGVARPSFDTIVVALTDDLIRGTPGLRTSAARGSAPAFSTVNVRASTGCGS
jgi:hypothetical protein